MSIGFPRLAARVLAATAAVGVAHTAFAEARTMLAHSDARLRGGRIRTSTSNVISYHVRPGTPGGTALVLDAGLLSSSLSWLLVLSHIPDDIPVVLYDRAGYRRSMRRCPEAYNLAESVTDLVEVVAAAVDGPCVLAGHSLGGYLCHQAAARMPERVRGVALVDPTHPGQLRNSGGQRAGAASTNLTVRLAPRSILAGGGLLLDKKGLLAYAEGNPHRRALSWEMSASSTWRASAREWKYMYPFMLDGGRPLDRLAVAVSVLAAGATESEVPEQLELYKGYVDSGDGGELRTLAGSTHLSIIGSPEYAPTTAAFLSEMVRGSR